MSGLCTYTRSYHSPSWRQLARRAATSRGLEAAPSGVVGIPSTSKDIIKLQQDYYVPRYQGTRSL